MYIRDVHAERDPATLHALLRSHPLGILTTAIPSPTHPLLQSTHIPFVLDVNDDGLARLRGHLARANPQAKAMIEALTAHPERANVLEQEVLVLFHVGPDHYVTPKFFTETKPLTGKVVPTWNYAAVQVYGRAKVYYDSGSEQTGSFLGRQVDDLTKLSEGGIMGYTGKDGKEGPWEVTDAPERYIELLKKAIIGVEVEVDRMEGKFKMSQEMSLGDRQGTVAGFAALGTSEGDKMAEVVRLRGEMRDAAKAKN